MGSPRGGPSEDLPGGGLGVASVVLAVAAAVLAARTVHLQYVRSPGPQEAREPGPVAARALVLGAALALALPRLGSALEVLIYPVLGILLYATFLQVLDQYHRVVAFPGLLAPSSSGCLVSSIPSALSGSARNLRGRLRRL